MIQAHGGVAGPRFYAEAALTVTIGATAGSVFYHICFKRYHGYEYMQWFVFIPLLPWAVGAVVGALETVPARCVAFVKLSCCAGMISDSIVMVFSTRLACDRPHIAFAIALGLVIVAR